MSNKRCNKISIYAVSNGAHIRSFGGTGAEPGQFDCPEKLVYNRKSGSLLVAEFGNKRVQEVSPAGEAVRLIGAGVIHAPIDGIACNDCLVAVGKSDFNANNRVMLFDYGSGALVRSFGDWGDGVGQLRYCSGMRLTDDGRHIVVASGCNHGGFALSQFSVEGVLVKEVGRGSLTHVHDVEIAPSGDWIACDTGNSAIVVFSGVHGGEKRRWAVGGDSGKEAMYGMSMALSAGGELWVLDWSSARVQVFG